MELLPALLLALSLVPPCGAQTLARPASFQPASTAWGFVLRRFFESDFGRSAPLPPLLEALRPLDLMRPEPRLLAGPLTRSLASSMPAGRFAGLPDEQALDALRQASEEAARDAAARADQALGAVADEDVEEAAGLLGQLSGPLSLYVPGATSRRAGEALPALRARLEAARASRVLSAAERAARAMSPSPEPATLEPHLRVRRAQGPRETARLAREFAAGLSRDPDLEAKRRYVNGLWEIAEAPPYRVAQRVAARALARELRRSGRDDKHRLLVLRAMHALAGKTPYEEVERRLVGVALKESGSTRDAVAREAEFTVESVAVSSPFKSVRRMALRHFREASLWTGDDARRQEHERRVSRLQGPPAAGYWPSWKPPRPPSLWGRVLARLGF